ncbi:GntR family transcriptional regulator [Amycolatopsis nivea]
MSFDPPQTRGEAVLRQLRAEIIGGALAPGEVLRDAEIAARLKVSITPVREAIAQLAQEGLVEVSPNRWRRVAQMTLEEALATLDVQFILFGAALERAIPRMTIGDVDKMRDHLAALRTAVAENRAATAVEAVGGFFQTPMALTGNHELTALWGLVFGRGQRFMGLSGSSALWPVWLDGFAAVFAEVERQDPAAAARRVREMAAEVDEKTRAASASDVVLGRPSENTGDPA